MSDNITKRDLTLVVYNELKGEFAQRGERKLSQTQVYAVIESFQKHIVECLAEGKTIEIRNFGVFEVRLSKKRKGRNPREKDVVVVIPERATVRFKPGKEMREKVESISPSSMKKKGQVKAKVRTKRSSVAAKSKKAKR